MKTKVCPECGSVNTIDRDICFKCEVLLIDIPVESKKSKKFSFFSPLSQFEVLILFMLISPFVLVAILVVSGRSRKPARLKACISNMKMLENALEMYDMDTPPVEVGVTTVVCSDGRPEPASKYRGVLQNGGYIQRMPKCPIRNSLDAYSVHRKGVSSGYVMYVSCSVHGTISNPRE